MYDLEAYEAAHPEMEFIYWTTSLSRAIGSPEAESFNDQMRQYAIANGKPLFDVADILSHDPDGNPCYDNRDGRPYVGETESENYPDDGRNTPAICPHYTTEVDGGHLGSVSLGKIRAAKAFWVLMAQLSGWNPGLPPPTPRPPAPVPIEPICRCCCADAGGVRSKRNTRHRQTRFQCYNRCIVRLAW